MQPSKPLRLMGLKTHQLLLQIRYGSRYQKWLRIYETCKKSLSSVCMIDGKKRLTFMMLLNSISFVYKEKHSLPVSEQFLTIDMDGQQCLWVRRTRKI